MRLASFNPQGLSADTALGKAQTQQYRELRYDVLALPETHNNQHAYTPSDMIVSDLPKDPSKDPYAGVALLLSPRVLRAVKEGGRSGCVGTRIVWVRFTARTKTYTIVGVYMPTMTRKAPTHNEVLQELQKFLQTIPKRDCVIVLGDMNVQLPRLTPGVTGKYARRLKKKQTKKKYSVSEIC